MTGQTVKPRLPKPERVLALAATGLNVELDPASAADLARDAIRWRDRAQPRLTRWQFLFLAGMLSLATTQLVDFAFAIVRIWVGN